MTKVSTRLQTGAATSGKRPITDRDVSSAAISDADAATGITAAFGAIHDALRVASNTDESHQHSGESDRLLRIAADIAASARANPATAGGAENIGFDIAALVNASRLVPGDTCSVERVALIDEARPHLEFLTGCLNVLEGQVMQPRSALNAAVDAADLSGEALGKNDLGLGRSPAQIKTVFEHIAMHARTLELLLGELVAHGGDAYCAAELMTKINASEIIAANIGAMADDAIDGEIYGDWHSWMYGSKFAGAGKAVQA